MQHEKIIKRPDGSRVRITIDFRNDWNRKDPEWTFRVDTCEKGKRTWIGPYDSNNYSFRQLSMADRAKACREASLRRASPQEIEAAMLELWEKLRPSL